MASGIKTNTSQDAAGRLARARQLIGQTGFLQDITHLKKVSRTGLHKVAVFECGPKVISEHNQDTAVLLDVADYNTLLKLKESYTELLSAIEAQMVANLENNFDKLFARISSPENSVKVRTTFNATDDKLNSSFQPGGTEH